MITTYKDFDTRRQAKYHLEKMAMQGKTVYKLIALSNDTWRVRWGDKHPTHLPPNQTTKHTPSTFERLTRQHLAKQTNFIRNCYNG